MRDFPSMCSCDTWNARMCRLQSVHSSVVGSSRCRSAGPAVPVLQPEKTGMCFQALHAMLRPAGPCRQRRKPPEAAAGRERLTPWTWQLSGSAGSDFQRRERLWLGEVVWRVYTHRSCMACPSRNSQCISGRTEQETWSNQWTALSGPAGLLVQWKSEPPPVRNRAGTSAAHSAANHRLC